MKYYVVVAHEHNPLALDTKLVSSPKKKKDTKLVLINLPMG